ncbi:MAG: T9SS type A sorting domain-containing protein, partial [Bacteroidales bacterium]|nr:T9SS type A sorting domain-containing protein [Bacteroidales bacterium]
TLVKIDTIYKDQSPELNIYPNPVQTVAKISVNFLKPGDRANLVLFDYFGREIFRDLFGSNPYNFSREGIPGGFYILTVSNPTGKTFATGKLVIE